MSVSSVSSAVHPSTVNPPSEAVEGPGRDHDGDKDDLSAAVSAATAKPVSGQPAPGGGVYL